MIRRVGTLTTRASALANRRIVRGGGHKAPEYNEPGGYLFGRKPGVKYEREGWEYIWFGGLGISTLLIFLGNRYKPDTRIRTWAKEEALRQMHEEGDILDYKHTDYRV